MVCGESTLSSVFRKVVMFIRDVPNDALHAGNMASTMDALAKRLQHVDENMRVRGNQITALSAMGEVKTVKDLATALDEYCNASPTEQAATFLEQACNVTVSSSNLGNDQCTFFGGVPPFDEYAEVRFYKVDGSGHYSSSMEEAMIALRDLRADELCEKCCATLDGALNAVVLRFVANLGLNDIKFDVGGDGTSPPLWAFTDKSILDAARLYGKSLIGVRDAGPTSIATLSKTRD